MWPPGVSPGSRAAGSAASRTPSAPHERYGLTGPGGADRAAEAESVVARSRGAPREAAGGVEGPRQRAADADGRRAVDGVQSRLGPAALLGRLRQLGRQARPFRG